MYRYVVIPAKSSVGPQHTGGAICTLILKLAPPEKALQYSKHPVIYIVSKAKRQLCQRYNTEMGIRFCDVCRGRF